MRRASAALYAAQKDVLMTTLREVALAECVQPADFAQIIGEIAAAAQMAVPSTQAQFRLHAVN